MKLIVKKVKAGYRVVGERGRNMGTYKTLEAANYRKDAIEEMRGH